MQTKTKLKLYFSILMSVIILTFFLYTQYSKANTNNITNLVSPVLKVYFFDVGQGDSILIRTPKGKDVLIDGGPDSTVLERLGETLPFWDRYIDIVILTHPHSDHIQGLGEVLKRYKVGGVYEPDLKNISAEEAYFDSLYNAQGILEHKVVAGDKISLEKDLELDFIYPFTLEMDEEELNNDSIVSQLIFKGKKFLFVGDATSEVEAKIISADLDSDFLKVGHHGSRYSSSTQFLAKVTPLVSIISVGEGNSFGHPTKDTLDRLLNVGSKILRTDKNGSIEVDVGGNGEWVINCSKKCN